MRRRARSRMAGIALAVLLAGVSACLRAAASDVEPTTPLRSPWEIARETAERLVLEERYRDADSVLHAFEAATNDPRALEESRFRRVLLQVDPSNPDATPRRALEAIDAYLAGGSGQPHYQVVLVLRRLTGELIALREAPRPAPIVLGDTALLRQRTEEVARLRDSLDRTVTELERIRRRLRSTRPDEPPPTQPLPRR